MASNNVLTRETVLQKCKAENLDDILNLNLWGKEIQDVNIVKEMPNVEIISLSLNKISTLKPFQYCRKLQELYLRKNLIEDISEIVYLRKCKNLRILWLEENKVCEHDNYRIIIIKTLPQIHKLDNVLISIEERDIASKLAFEIKSNPNSPRVQFKQADSPKNAKKPEEIRKIKQQFSSKLESINNIEKKDNYYPNLNEKNDNISFLEVPQLPNFNSDNLKLRNIGIQPQKQQLQPLNQKEINFNMQKISNLSNNGFFPNNQQSKTSLTNNLDLGNNNLNQRFPPKYENNNTNFPPQLNYNNNLPSIHSNNMNNQNSNNGNYNLPLIQQYNYNNSNNSPQIQNFQNNANHRNTTPSKVNIIFAVKCLLDELNPSELDRARVAVEKRLSQIQQKAMKNNNI
jgi:hypothetical protein